MTIFQNQGIAINISQPLVRGGGFIDSVAPYSEQYNHLTNIFGGYWSASLRIRQPDIRIEDWIEDGLMRHVDVRGPGSGNIFEGFVNTVTVRRGGYTVRVGPLLDMANRAKLVYSAIDTSGAAPVTGLRLETAWTDGDYCQDCFGILEAVYSGGGISADEVDEILGLQLRKGSTTPKSNDLQLPADLGSGVVELEIAGYVRLLEKYVYNSSTTGTVNLSQKLTDVLTADPNSLINVNAARITSNTLAVPAWENDDRTAMQIVKGLVAEGDSSLSQYRFGIFNGRTPLYEPVDDTVYYVRAAHERRQAVFLAGGGYVDPWEIETGRWLQQSDLAVGRHLDRLIDDPRAMMIESVRYTAGGDGVDQVSINGMESFRIDRKLAQLGLSGVGG